MEQAKPWPALYLLLLGLSADASAQQPPGFGSPDGTTQPDKTRVPEPRGGEKPPPGFSAPPDVLPPVREQNDDPQPHEAGTPVPPGYHVEKRVRRGLVIGGAITLGLSYLGALAQDERRGGGGVARLPLLGPFLVDGPNKDFWLLNGVAQLTGATLLGIGYFAKKSFLVPGASTSELRMYPVVWSGGVGVGLVGNL